jgi:hypothetical protein
MPTGVCWRTQAPRPRPTAKTPRAASQPDPRCHPASQLIAPLRSFPICSAAHLAGSAFHARYISSAYTEEVPLRKDSAPSCTSDGDAAAGAAAAGAVVANAARARAALTATCKQNAAAAALLRNQRAQIVFAAVATFDCAASSSVAEPRQQIVSHTTPLLHPQALPSIQPLRPGQRTARRPHTPGSLALAAAEPVFVVQGPEKLVSTTCCRIARWRGDAARACIVPTLQHCGGLRLREVQGAARECTATQAPYTSTTRGQTLEIRPRARPEEGWPVACCMH